MARRAPSPKSSPPAMAAAWASSAAGARACSGRCCRRAMPSRRCGGRRLEEQLGTFTLEPLDLRAGAIMEEPFRLAGLATLTGLAQLLPEREPHPRVYEALRVVLEAIEDDELWPALLVRWELGLLDELGFGLDLSQMRRHGSARKPRLCLPPERQGRFGGSRRALPEPAVPASALPVGGGHGAAGRRDRGAEACGLLPRAARVRAARDARFPSSRTGSSAPWPKGRIERAASTTLNSHQRRENRSCSDD